LRELAGQVGRETGTPEGGIVSDRSGFARKGAASAGVQRQWPGRLGRVGDGQVGVLMAYAWYHEPARGDVRPYPPGAWAKGRARRKRCGLPKAVRYPTRHERAPEMPRETGPPLRHGWATGDHEMGRSSRSRAEPRRLNGHYLRAVRSNTTVGELGGAVPQWVGRGPHPRRASGQARARSGSLPEGAWGRIEVGDGERGPLLLGMGWTRVVARADRGRLGPEELSVAIRRLEGDGATRHDDYLSEAPRERRPGVLARVARAEHRVGRCPPRGQSEAGPAESRVRTRSGWHHPRA
jgi:hypothetical protein